MKSSAMLGDVTEHFITAVERALQLQPFPDGRGPLHETTRIGKGGNGFVLRGYVHVHDSESHERVRWLVVKGPLPHEIAPGAFAQTNDSLKGEYETRKAMGDIAGLALVPDKVKIPASLVRAGLPSDIRDVLVLRSQVALLVFELRDARVVEVPPGNLAQLVTGPVVTDRDLYNWCEIARALGNALLGLHSRNWIHRDIKLSNVVAQREGGFLRSIELIDVGSATGFGERAEPPRAVGATAVGTRSYRRPERVRDTQGPGEAWTPPSPVDEDVYAYASLLARVLLGTDADHPDVPLAAEIENLVADVVLDKPVPVEPLGAEIHRALSQVGELLRTNHYSSVEPLSGFLRDVERIRVAALGLMSSRRGSAPERLGLLPDLLGSLEVYVDADQEARWIERYRASDRAAALAEMGRAGHPPSVGLAADLLRCFYVTAARGVLDELLELHGGAATDEDARAVRLHVGQILLREGDDARGLEILRRYEDKLAAGPPYPAVAWWIGMLRARLDFRAHQPVSLDGLDAMVPEPRGRMWLDALRAQMAIRGGTPVDPALVRRLLDAVRHTPSSTSERLFTLLLLSLTLAQQGDLVQALRWLHTGIGEASARDFPIEHADLLVGAAHALLLYTERGELARQGVDVQALFATGERLAIHAADLLHRMGVGIERDHAIRIASRCAKERGGVDGITAATCWHELAAANTSLSRPSSELTRMTLQVSDDPGTSGARVHLSRHGWALEQLWGTGGLSIEIIERDAPRIGAALEALLDKRAEKRPPRRILVVGCGTGSEVFQLAGLYPHARIHGIDAFSWNIAKAEEQALSEDPDHRCSFRCADPVRAGATEDLGGGGGPWDLVVMRETLAHVTFKRRFLRALRRHIPPGADVCVSDFVQLRESGPKEWRPLLHSLGVTNLASPEGLLADFESAGFQVLPGIQHDPGPLLAFFANRSARLEEPGSQLWKRFESLSFARDLLKNVIEASKKGVLGWVRLVATADGEPTEPSYDEPPA